MPAGGTSQDDLLGLPAHHPCGSTLLLPLRPGTRASCPPAAQGPNSPLSTESPQDRAGVFQGNSVEKPAPCPPLTLP